MFPEDDLHRLLRRVMKGGMLEQHDHGGIVASTSEVFAVGELAETGPLSQQELGERLGLEKSTVSRLAAGLEKRGWLARERDPDNRRYYRLALTAGGRTAARRLGEHLAHGHALLLDGLTAEERAGLVLGLAGIARVQDAQRCG